MARSIGDPGLSHFVLFHFPLPQNSYQKVDHPLTAILIYLTRNDKAFGSYPGLWSRKAVSFDLNPSITEFCELILLSYYFR